TDGSGGKGWYALPSGGGVPTSRVLTINGVSYDLSLDRSWTISTGVSGSGITNRTAVWNSSGSITSSSIMTDIGTQISIGGHLIINSGVFGLGLFSSDPSSPNIGTFYFNTSINRPKYYNGSSWVTI
ncbi:MAG: hypothetical protein J7619_23230, partial [Dyadobacter sp.]|uniref:hypothetical protein n=1 Tax=Dyadobacter sp. TaxID=1914288 RepID=UPI001B11A833